MRTAAPATPTPPPAPHPPAWGQAACRGRSPRPLPRQKAEELATGPPSCRVSTPGAGSAFREQVFLDPEPSPATTEVRASGGWGAGGAVSRPPPAPPEPRQPQTWPSGLSPTTITSSSQLSEPCPRTGAAVGPRNLPPPSHCLLGFLGHLPAREASKKLHPAPAALGLTSLGCSSHPTGRLAPGGTCGQLPEPQTHRARHGPPRCPPPPLRPQPTPPLCANRGPGAARLRACILGMEGICHIAQHPHQPQLLRPRTGPRAAEAPAPPRVDRREAPLPPVTGLTQTAQRGPGGRTEAPWDTGSAVLPPAASPHTANPAGGTQSARLSSPATPAPVPGSDARASPGQQVLGAEATGGWQPAWPPPHSELTPRDQPGRRKDSTLLLVHTPDLNTGPPTTPPRPQRRTRQRGRSLSNLPVRQAWL